MTTLEKEILHVFEYFLIFDYPPTKKELYTYIRVKTTLKELSDKLNSLIERKKIMKYKSRYVLSESFEIAQKYEQRIIHSRLLLRNVSLFFPFLKVFPCVQYLALSGSISQQNTSKSGDVDIFLIVLPGTAWLCRAYALSIKKILSIFASSEYRKVCINLIFSMDNLEMKKNKKNEYIAHELIQLQVVFDKHNIHKLLLERNNWILKILPNVHIKCTKITIYKDYQNNIFIKILEKIVKKLQTQILSRNHIVWQEDRGNIWFIQKDFEKKILENLRSFRRV